MTVPEAEVQRYVPRHVDALVERALRTAGAVEIRGARATGKTATGMQMAASMIRMDSSSSEVTLAQMDPRSALAGATPRLIDEWQMIPGLWNAVRHEVDDRQARGQFILTGSASPDDDPTRHSGAGRFRHIAMRTMTFAETGHSSGQVSLASLLKGEDIPQRAALDDFEAVVRRIVTGGWPGWYRLDELDAREAADAYLDDIVEKDYVTVAGTRRDPRRMRSYLQALAALVAQSPSMAAIRRRMQDEFAGTIGEQNVSVVHDLAERLFIVEDQPAWSTRLRSATVAATAPKRHLADPSLAAALLNVGSARLLQDPETLGFLFESQVVHDLRVYAQSARARGVFHFRDTKGRDEIDVVIENADGDWLAIEVKLGHRWVDAAAENLQRVTAKMERAPLASIVIVPTGLAYTRPDGIRVVPLTALGA